MVNLVEVLSSATKQLSSLNVVTKTMTAADMFDPKEGITWLTDTSWGVDETVLGTMLLQLPQPPIYVHERPDGRTYAVLLGGEQIETLRAVINERGFDNMSDGHLTRRILRTEFPIVVFRASMSYDDACACVRMLIGVDV